MAERPRSPPIPYHEADSRPPPVTENVGHVASIPPPSIDPEVERRFRAIEDGFGSRISNLENDFRGQKDGLVAHVNMIVTTAVDAKLTEKIGPLRAQITSEFTQQNVMLADISVFVKTIAKRMHGLAMESSAEFAPIDKRIDGRRKHKLAIIGTACTVVALLASLVAMAINSQRGQPVAAPNVAATSHH